MQLHVQVESAVRELEEERASGRWRQELLRRWFAWRLALVQLQDAELSAYRALRACGTTRKKKTTAVRRETRPQQTAADDPFARPAPLTR